MGSEQKSRYTEAKKTGKEVIMLNNKHKTRPSEAQVRSVLLANAQTLLTDPIFKNPAPETQGEPRTSTSKPPKKKD